MTSDELASLCKVSQGTVDRALNGKKGISEKTRRLVLETAAKYGYRKNMRASALSSGKSKILGLVVLSFNNEFFAQIATEAEKSAQKRGYTVMIAQSFTDIEKEKDCLMRLFSMGVDGLILCSVGKGEKYGEFLRSFSKPIVGIFNKPEGGFPFVGTDDFSAMEESVEKALSLGYEKFVLYCPPLKEAESKNAYAQIRRKEGFLSALTKIGKSGVISYEEEEVFSSLNGEKTAVMCTSDYYALKLKEYLSKRGKESVKDYGLSSFDNISALKFLKDRPVTVAYSAEEIAKRCVETLVDMIDGKEAKEVFVPYTIEEGNSL